MEAIMNRPMKDQLFDFFVKNKGNIELLYDDQGMIISIMIKDSPPYQIWNLAQEMIKEKIYGTPEGSM